MTPACMHACLQVTGPRLQEDRDVTEVVQGRVAAQFERRELQKVRRALERARVCAEDDGVLRGDELVVNLQGAQQAVHREGGGRDADLELQPLRREVDELLRRRVDQRDAVRSPDT